jgi:hypothetical protein
MTTQNDERIWERLPAGEPPPPPSPPRRRRRVARPPALSQPPAHARAAKPPRWSPCSSAKTGPPLAEIMDKMGWQRHTVRGFMAGAMKKAGYSVEFFKPEGGQRTYRLPK